MDIEAKMEQDRNRSNPLVWFVGLVVIAAIGMVLLNVDLSSLKACAHAVERHGNDATVATQWVSTHGGPGNRWDCNDGRQRWIVPYNAHEWAIVVMEGVTQITAFITDDQDYVMKQHEGCNQWQNWAHP